MPTGRQAFFLLLLLWTCSSVLTIYGRFMHFNNTVHLRLEVSFRIWTWHTRNSRASYSQHPPLIQLTRAVWPVQHRCLLNSTPATARDTRPIQTACPSLWHQWQATFCRPQCADVCCTRLWWVSAVYNVPCTMWRVQCAVYNVSSSVIQRRWTIFFWGGRVSMRSWHYN